MVQDKPQAVAQQQSRRRQPRRRLNHGRQPRPKPGDIDWAKFSNLRSKSTAKEFRAICEPFLSDRESEKELLDSLERPDGTGLRPIHWFAVNNRADLIKVLASYGCSISQACDNAMLSKGTPLHLAAMNGSLEAAAALIEHWRRRRQNEASRISSDQEINAPADFLNERDAGGQTPLMRTAAPKSRRLNVLYDLLRKNFWSMNGRPAEMALYLIGNGANWRLTEPRNGMNLLHLAIANDYEDIANLMLVIDLQLIDVRVKFNPEPGSSSARDTERRQNARTNNNESLESRPLLDKDVQILDKVLHNGLTPLELAILYRRVGLIDLLWSVSMKRGDKINKQSEKSLKSTLFQASYSNRDELVRFLKPLIYRLALIFDLSMLILVWTPLSLEHTLDRLVFSSLMASFAITFTFAMRTILKDPGYLRINSVQYLNEMSEILATNSQQVGRSSTASNVQIDQMVSSSDRGKDKPIDLIKLSDRELLVQRPGFTEANREAADKGKRLTRIVVPQEIKSETSVVLSNQNQCLSEKVRLLCHKCRCVRRARSRHCDSCNQCVQDFDHHCLYLGCCIGRFNRFDFLATMIMLTVASTYATIIFMVASPSHGGTCSSLLRFIGFVWVFKYIFIGGYNAFMNLRGACNGVTMYERVRGSRIRENFGQEAIEALGRRKFWRFPPNQFLTGDLSLEQILNNLREFTNETSLDVYLLNLICADTPLVRALNHKQRRVNMYKFA